MRMFPLAYRMVTAGVGEEREMLQLRFAWALRCSVNVSVQDVHSSTPVRGVLSIEPVIDVGRAPLFEGCSYRAKTAYLWVSSFHTFVMELQLTQIIGYGPLQSLLVMSFRRATPSNQLTNQEGLLLPAEGPRYDAF